MNKREARQTFIIKTNIAVIVILFVEHVATLRIFLY